MREWYRLLVDLHERVVFFLGPGDLHELVFGLGEPFVLALRGVTSDDEFGDVAPVLVGEVAGQAVVEHAVAQDDPLQEALLVVLPLLLVLPALHSKMCVA